MKRILSLTLVALLVASVPAAAQMAQPGPEHELLAKLAGEWEGTTTIHIPGMDPVSTPASTVSRMELGGFWLIGEFKGSMMGVEFNGHSVVGYDPGKGKFIETWVSNLTPEATVLEGDYDPATRTWSKYRDDAKDVFTGQSVMERHQMTLVDDDTYTLTIAQKAEGGDYQVLVEMKQTRKK